MKRFMGAGPVAESSWTEGLARLQKGQAAMMVMGDWAKGELMQSGWQPGVDFACLPVATNRSAHLYSVDTLTLFAKDYAKVSSQERLARLAVSAAVQDEYNALKGSVSVRRDADLAGMDVCAKASWRDFARGEAHRAPSLVHRMATDESTKETLLAELHRYFVDDRIAPTDVQKRWSTLSRWRPTPSAP
jgi:glucose/mannose transport system substrate-binding protein